MARLAFDLDEDVRSLGFWVREGRPGTMRRGHAHTDIEGNLLLSGSMTYLHGGRRYLLRPGVLTLFWAGIPHRLIAAEDCQIIWLVLPLAWYMQWQLPEAVTQRLLCGEMIESADEGDERLFRGWARDCARPDGDLRRIVMLEVEARMRRFARAVAGGAAQHPSADDATGAHAEQLAAFMARHYRQNLSVARITSSVSLHPNYAMQLFKKRCGMGLWEYLIRLRISHAQRLLLTTDWKIQRIAMESGFATAGRFYEAFSRISGCTPRHYRKALTL